MVTLLEWQKNLHPCFLLLFAVLLPHLTLSLQVVTMAGRGRPVRRRAPKRPFTPTAADAEAPSVERNAQAIQSIQSSLDNLTAIIAQRLPAPHDSATQNVLQTQASPPQFTTATGSTSQPLPLVPPIPVPTTLPVISQPADGIVGDSSQPQAHTTVVPPARGMPGATPQVLNTAPPTAQAHATAVPPAGGMPGAPPQVINIAQPTLQPVLGTEQPEMAIDRVLEPTNSTLAGNFSFARPVPVDDHVDLAIIKKIKNNEFIPFHLLLKKSYNEEAEVFLTASKQLQSKARDPPTISFYEWTSAWNIYISVMSINSSDNTLTSRMCKHFEQVFILKEKKDDWRLYDTRFRKSVAKGNAKWGDVQYNLVMDARAPSGSSQGGRDSNTAAGEIVVPKYYCYSHHQSKSCRNSNCNYYHKCFVCGKFHSYLDCPKGKGTQQFSPQSSFPRSSRNGPNNQNGSKQRSGHFGGRRF